MKYQQKLNSKNKYYIELNDMKNQKLLNSEDKYSAYINDIKEIKNNNLLLNITSKYNLKLLFSYLKYDYILKLVKNSKSLQNKLGLDKQNYKNYSNIKIIPIEEKSWETGYIDQNYYPADIICVCIYLFLFLNIFYVVYVNIIQKNLNISFVNISNYSLWGLFIFDIVFSVLISNIFHVFHVYSYLFFNIIHILYEILISIKLKIIFKYYFSKSDFFFLINNYVYIIFNFRSIIYYWPNFGKRYKYYLIEYKNIPIIKYYIENVDNFNKNHIKSNSVLGINLEYNYLKEDFKVLIKINNFREKNNLPKFEKDNYLPDFIIHEISEVILNNSPYILKLSKNKYIMKYELGTFNYYFQNNNPDLLKILLKKDLNTINIITQGNIQYILLYDYF